MSELARSSSDADRLSDLPESLLLHILSFLPTKTAIRTSLLSRRYCRLYTASPSVYFDRSKFPPGPVFATAISRYFLLRDPSAALLSFTLRAYGLGMHLPIETASAWLSRAHSRGLRDLYLDICSEDFKSLFPLILTFRSLQSLQIRSSIRPGHPAFVPPNFLATGLRSLCLSVVVSTSGLKRFIVEQCNLEDLCLHICDPDVDLMSRSVKTLKLFLHDKSYSDVNLLFPALEVLKLSTECLDKFRAEMPLLREADIRIQALTEDCVPVFGDMLRCITNASQLSIHLNAGWKPLVSSAWRPACRKIYCFRQPFHLLVAPGKDLPMFPYLRSLKLLTHFHEDGISDLICFLMNASVLEYVELYHVYNEETWAKKGWESKLPQDSEGNNQHAHFLDLHLGDGKIEVIRVLSALCNGNPRKKLKM